VNYSLANLKSSKKRIKVTAKKTLRNKMIKSRVRTEIKKVISAVRNNDKEKALVNFKIAVKVVDQAASKGIYHKNNAARKKSRLAKLINKLSA
jgi:small subunit ribosomal protein S20